MSTAVKKYAHVPGELEIIKSFCLEYKLAFKENTDSSVDVEMDELKVRVNVKQRRYSINNVVIDSYFNIRARLMLIYESF